MSHHPSFPLFPSDLIIGAALMDDTQFGIYVRLLCHQWVHGGLPNDEGILCQLVTSAFIPVIVMKKFKLHEDGLLRNRRMEIERTKLLAAQTSPAVNPVPETVLLNGELDSYCKREGIAPILQSSGFPEAWRDWKGYRIEIKEPLSSYSGREALGRCERWGAKKSVLLIRRAIRESWKNIKEDADLTAFGASLKIEPAKETLTERWQKNNPEHLTFSEWRTKNNA